MYIKKIVLFIVATVSHYTYSAEVVKKINPTYTLVMHDTSFTIQASTPNTDKKQRYLVIGIISCEVHKKRLAEITLLEVNEKYLGQKVGTNLVIDALQHIRNSGITTVRWVSTIEAMPFYDRIGAKRVNKPRANFEYIFDRDGDPEENLKKYYATKNK